MTTSYPPFSFIGESSRCYTNPTDKIIINNLSIEIYASIKSLRQKRNRH